MSTGRRHERIGKRVLKVAGLVGAASAVEVGWQAPLLFLAGAAAGFYLLTPDADFGALSRHEARWFREPRRGELASFLRAVASYQVGLLALALGLWPGMFLTHRRLSHVPLLGALAIGALALLSPAVLAVLAATGWWRVLVARGALPLWLGFAGAHLVHIVMDWVD